MRTNKKNQQVLTIFFDGGDWKLHQEQSDYIIQLTCMLKDIPELCDFVQGFLCNDYSAVLKSYFITFLFIYLAASLHAALALALLSFFLYFAFIFATQKVEVKQVAPSDIELFIAMNIYFTYRRIYVYLSKEKAFLAIAIFLFVFLALKPFFIGIIIPMTISSLLIQTESNVSRMRYRFT